MSESRIYHCTTPQAWAEAQVTGHYVHPSLEAEGFIHLSQADQLAGVVSRYYRGRTDMILLVLDAQQVADALDLRWEAAKAPRPDGSPDIYPHIYGPIPVSLVLHTSPLIQHEDGSIAFEA